MAADAEQAQEGQAKAKIFISYSRKDMAFADRLEAALKARGFEPLIDRAEIYAFEDWWKRIEALIGRADTVVFILSPDAVKSDVALKEVTAAASLNKRFAPIVYRRVEEDRVPEALRRLNFIFFDEAAIFEASADHLAAALQIDIGWVRQHTEYGEAARRWLAAGRPNGLLLRSPVLEEAERWIGSRPRDAPEPTEKARAFVLESRREATRQRRRIEVLAVVLVAATIAGLAAWREENWLKEQFYVLLSVHALSTAQERALKPKDMFKECTDCPEMIVAPAGNFTMGLPDSEMQPLGAEAKALGEDEGPQHNVTIAKPFAVAKFDVTFEQWDVCVARGSCPPHIRDSDFGHGQRPVINVSWDEAQTYVVWLGRITGKPYRLLTEAEWEYAARAGTTTAYYWGEDIGQGNANCHDCGSQWDGKQTSPIGSFAPNQFGLYDMAGNVYQWVQDCYHNNYDGAPIDGSAWTSGDCSVRVTRGGSWRTIPEFLKSGFRDSPNHNYKGDDLGFRVGRALPARSPEIAVGQLTVTGPHELAFTGEQGGPFSPKEILLQLKATSRGFHWSIADATPPWLKVIPHGGDLVADGSAEVTLTLSPAAQSLAPGRYESQVVLKNDSSGALATSNVGVVVSPKPPPPVVVAPPVVSGLVPLSADRERALRPKDTFKECDKCPEMIVVPAGSFTMGSPANEPPRYTNEGPQHGVTFARQFAVGKFSLTFDEWDACVADGGCNGYRPDDEGWGRGGQPVINVSWDDAKAYVAWLAKKTGKSYRLLSEAEREYVTRAGTTTPFWWGSSISTSQANYDGRYTYGNGVKGEYRKRAMPVDSFAPNPWGLYQVHGNLSDWTEDCYHTSYQRAPADGSAWLNGECSERVLRGGTWESIPDNLRSANRSRNTTDIRNRDFGFRVGRTPTL
jgi:formylglycine-generating enzyme required for sulfatase activity